MNGLPETFTIHSTKNVLHSHDYRGFMNDPKYLSLKAVNVELTRECAEIGKRRSTWSFHFEDKEYETTAWIEDGDAQAYVVTKGI